MFVLFSARKFVFKRYMWAVLACPDVSYEERSIC